MNYCERVNEKKWKIDELKGLIKKETGLHAYIKFQDKSFYVNIVNFTKNIKFRCIFSDFSVIPVGVIDNKYLNGLKFVWNKFLAETFGEEYKKAYHEYYFKNTDIDILKKDDTQEK